MNTLKYWWFLFRWFLIGKNHCSIEAKYKRVWWIVHKLLWTFITFGICANIYFILGFLHE